jgi:multicomponent K+:H+ antiporter subunit E
VKRLLPAPLLSALLLVVWLLLEGSLAAGSVLLGVVLALAIPAAVAPLRPQRVRVRRPLAIARLVLVVAHDVIASNFSVAAQVLLLRHRLPHSRFVRIPLAMRDPNGIATLALITTIVPGTVWIELALDRSAFVLHVFDVEDAAAFAAYYKARYERLLMEIFE